VKVLGAAENNLKDVAGEFPRGCLVVVSGSSGAGKSTRVYRILYHAFAGASYGSRQAPGLVRTLLVRD